MSEADGPALAYVEAGSNTDYFQAVVERFGIQLSASRPSRPYLAWDGCLSLVQPNTKISPITVDFLGGKNKHRREFGGGIGQMLCKAVGLKPQLKPTVLDMTAGLGQDAFVLASLGCQLAMQERSPYAAALLYDGLQRLAAADPALAANLQLQFADSREHRQAQQYQVVYLDPMYPEHKQKAAVNKSMTVFRELIGKDEDADDLLAAAFAQASHRVVVKRPKKGRLLAGKEPNHQLLGKSSRYDIYTIKALS